VNVTIACPCPDRGEGRPHETDTVTLRDKLDFKQGVTIRKALGLLYTEDPDAGFADVLGVLTEQYLLLGIESWTLVDAKGEKVTASKPAIRALMDAHPETAMDIGNQADALYNEQVLLPLLTRSSTPSPDSPTAESTSATDGTSPTPPTPSRPSLISTSQTADTEPTTTSEGSAYSSSQSSTSAA
jgi:hypothetical protein